MLYPIQLHALYVPLPYPPSPPDLFWKGRLGSKQLKSHKICSKASSSGWLSVSRAWAWTDQIIKFPSGNYVTSAMKCLGDGAKVKSISFGCFSSVFFSFLIPSPGRRIRLVRSWIKWDMGHCQILLLFSVRATLQRVDKLLITNICLVGGRGRGLQKDFKKATYLLHHQWKCT